MDKHSRLKWRCRRGALELDILLEAYLSTKYDAAPPDEQAAFERLLTLSDPELMAYLMGSRTPDDPALANVANRIRAGTSTGA